MKQAIAPPPRVTRFTSTFYLRRTERIWEWLMVSLALDPLLPFLTRDWSTPILLREQLTGAAVACAALAAALAFLNPAIFISEQVMGLRKKLLAHDNRWFLYLAMVFLVLLAVGEFVLRMLSFRFEMVVGALLVLGAAAFSVWRSIQDIRERWNALNRYRILWVEHVNFQIFLGALLPLILSRAVSPLLLFGMDRPSANDALFTAFAVGMSAILLGSHRPVPSHFIAPCPVCRRLTSRALRSIDGCPHCKPDTFAVNGADSKAEPPRERKDR